MIKLENIRYSYNSGESNEKTVLKDVNLDVEKGDFITIVGSNGAGKSTLLKLITGEICPENGNYMLEGKKVNNSGMHKLSRKIGRVFQNPNGGVFNDLCIRENLIISSKKGMRSFRFGKYNDFGLELLGELNLGLENRLDIMAGELSGGQKQGLAMVMAVSSSPSLLLLDEHTASLDPVSAARVMELTKKINEKYGITIMMITHNTEFAANYGNRLLKITDGTLFELKDRKKMFVS